MAKFKKGDKVRVIAVHNRFNIGEILTVKEDDSMVPYCIDKNGICYAVHEDYLQLLEKTWENLEEGDVLIGADGDERHVLGVCGRVIFVSDNNNKNKTSWYYTKEEMIKLGWTIKQNTPTEPREVTMTEVIEKFGENVVIKK